MIYRLIAILVLVVVAAGCGKKKPPVVAAPAPAPSPVTDTATAAPTGTTRLETLAVPPLPSIPDDAVKTASLDDLNKNSPFKPVYFQLDSADLDDAGRAVASANAEILKKNPTWVVTIEGHCDERGSAEYNLALGERRAQAARAFLISLGIAQNRVKTVSYGKEYPFDPGHSDTAWASNRRGHFVITSR
jgi:peptidoglycan-associated lipoprotein